MKLERDNFYILGNEVYRKEDRKKIGNFHKLENLEYITLQDKECGVYRYINGNVYKSTLSEIAQLYRGKK